jgi:hypothetical protein
MDTVLNYARWRQQQQQWGELGNSPACLKISPSRLS